MTAHRNQAHYWAFVLHRVSGIALAAFLPVHFYVLALAFENPTALDALLTWTENPLLKLAEGGLVVLLAAHLTGGARLLVIEFLPWHDWQKTAAALAGGASLVIGLVFLLNAY